MTIQEKFAWLASAGVLAAGICAPSTQAQESAQASMTSRYQMSAVMDRARGRVVLSGDYEKAIQMLSRKRERRFESSTNLCVAYTMTGELAKADVECATAVTLSEKSTVSRDHAVALSNRGVVKAMSGNFSGARQDFSHALKLNTRLPQASENLQLLSQLSPSDS